MTPPETLPSGWIELPLGELGTWRGGGTPSKANSAFWTGGTIPWVSPKDMKRLHISEAEDKITEAAVASSGTQLIPERSVLIVTRSGILQHSLPVAANTVPVAINQDLKALTPHPGIGSEYLMRQLQADAQEILKESAKSGTTVESIDFHRFKQHTFRLAPQPEQKRIVAKIDGLTARTARACAELARLPVLIARYKQRLLALAFSGELTASWRDAQGLAEPVEVELSSVAKGFSYGSSAKSALAGNIPVLRMGNIQGGKLDWTNLVFTSDKAEIAKYTLEAGDVLFNRTNSPELVGKTALYNGEKPAIYAGYLIRIRCTELLLPEFLTYCLNGPAGRAYCWQVKTDGVSQSNINAKKIAAFRFLLPGLDEQAEIVRRIDSAFSWLERVDADHAGAAKLLPRLDGAILAKAFRGELVPQDPNDEPAGALMERIRGAQTKMSDRVRRKNAIKSKESLMVERQLPPSERILRDSEDWPMAGLPVAEVMSRNALPHDDFRDALFDLLSRPESRLRQEFDKVAETMMIKRVAA